MNIPQNRKAAFVAINTERDYQDKVWGDSASSGKAGSGERTIDEYALYIEGYARDLANIASHSGDPEEKLNFVRKVAGLCVACMEEHGAPQRQ